MESTAKWGSDSLQKETALTCSVCGYSGQPIITVTQYGKGREFSTGASAVHYQHFKATCSACMTWIKWVPKSRLWRALLELQRVKQEA